MVERLFGCRSTTGLLTRLVGLAGTAAVAAALGVVSAGPAVAVPPLGGPFFAPPSNFAQAAAGTILKSRPIQVTTVGLPLPLNTEAWQLMFRTSRADGSPSFGITTVLAPSHSSGTPRLLSYQLFEDATSPQCAPSRNLTLGAGGNLDGATAVSAAVFSVVGALDQGWTVSIPDHQGPASSFLAPREPGFVALDAARAAARFAPLHLTRNVPVVATGYSGGALATGWVAQEQPTYAPDVNLVGATMGGTPVDIQAVPEHLANSLESGQGLFIVSGLRYTFPQFRAVLDRYLTRAGRGVFDALERSCSVLNTLVNIARPWAPLFTKPFAQVWRDPGLASTFAAARLDSRPTPVPRLLVHGLYDEIVPVTTVNDYATAQCRAGANLTLRREVAGTHFVTAVTGLPYSLQWADDAVAGRLHPTCGQTTVPSLLTDSRSPTIGFLVATARGLLGSPR